eukprot:g2477.t1
MSSERNKKELVITAVVSGLVGAALTAFLSKLSIFREDSSYSSRPRRKKRVLSLATTPSTPDVQRPREKAVEQPLRRARLSPMRKNRTLSALSDGCIIEPRRSVTVRVPATSANMGPGFDCIGMALDIWSEITVTIVDDDFQSEPDVPAGTRVWITAIGEGADALRVVTGKNSEKNLIYEGLCAAFDAAEKPMPKLRVSCVNRIPFARGMGSSSAAIVGGLICGLALTGHELSVWGNAVSTGGMQHDATGEQLLQLACELEGHPDNVAPAIYGGIQLGLHSSGVPLRGDGKSQPDGGRWLSARVSQPDGLVCVVFIPDSVFETKEARALLPESYTRAETVFNITRMALLMNALERSNLRDLQFGTQDCMHQPQRGTVVKHLNPMIDDALEAGAHAAFLSGAGPTVLALVSGSAGDIFIQRRDERKERDVASAMRKAAKEAGVPGRVYITRPTMRGAHIVSAEPPYSGDKIRFPGDI